VKKISYPERIKEIRHHFKMNQAEFANHTNILRSALSEFESGHREPTREFIQILSELGISIDWLLTGNGPMIKPSKGLLDIKFYNKKPTNGLKTTPSNQFNKDPPGIPLVYEGSEGLEGGVVIPLLENAASAGYGSGVDDNDTPVRYIQVPHHLSKYPHLAGLPVKGDSMEPTLHDGDLVVCDGGGWDGDGLYVIKTHDSSYVKRVQLRSDGYRVISDNKMYESFVESPGDLSIVGKVRAILVMMAGRRGV